MANNGICLACGKSEAFGRFNGYEEALKHLKQLNEGGDENFYDK